MRTVRLAVVVCLLVRPAAPGRSEEGPETLVLASFEGAGGKERITTKGSRSEAVAARSGRGIRWETEDGADPAELWVRTEPFDLRPYGLLRFSLRAPKPIESIVWFRLASSGGDVTVSLPAAGPEWTEVEVPVPAMDSRPGFDPAGVLGFELYSHRAASFVLDVDEVRLVRSPGGWRGAGDGEEGFRFVVADFETPAGSRFEVPEEGCAGEVVESGEGHALRLTGKGRFSLVGVGFDNMPEDLRPFRFLSLRARLVSGSATGVRLWVTGSSGTLEAVLPRLGPDWSEVRLSLPEMEADETFDASKVSRLGLYSLSSSKPVIELDDLAVIVGGAGWRYTALEQLARGPHEAAPVLSIADFEAENSLDSVLVEGGKVERVKVKRKRDNGTGHALKFEVEGEGETAHLYLRRVPRDLRDFRVLRFLARADRDTDADVQVRVESRGGSGWFSGAKGSLGLDVVGFTKAWKRVEILLPDVPALGDFDPEHVVSLHLSRKGPMSVSVDEFELVKGAGGCRRTDREELARVFGKDVVDAVTELDSEHFRVFTDDPRPDKKLAKRLEAQFDRVDRLVHLPDLPRPVEVFLVGDREAFEDPYLREGMSVDRVGAAAGFARAGALVACVADVDAPAFVHELAHAVVQRALGSGGGAWLQDGLAELAALRSAGNDPAALYRETVRARDRIPLPDLLVDPDPSRHGKGGALLMAAAFTQFLLEGPPAARSPDALRRLTLLTPGAPRQTEALEEILATPFADLEREWTEWIGE